MQNPFRSEEEAFRVVIRAVPLAAVVVVASLINRWLGLAAAAAVAVLVVWWLFFRGEPKRPVQTVPTRTSGEGEIRLLVVANETVGGEKLRRCIQEKIEGLRAEVYVVAPALNTPLRHWVSDEDEARAAAQERLDASLARLREAEIEARGEVGPADPLQAIEDALRTFGADEIVISTHPEGRSNWLERGVVTGARERFAVPITHVVVDAEGGAVS